MALIHCPECKQQVSSFADACPHCGFPLGVDDPECSVVMLSASQGGAIPLRKFAKALHVSEAQAKELLSSLPAVIWQGLPVDRAYGAVRPLGDFGVFKVVADRDCGSPEQIRAAAPVPNPKEVQQNSGTPFWHIVGAVFTALLLWNLALLFLTPFAMILS